MTCGIYKLSFKNTDKVYIGRSLNIEGRIRGHRHTLINLKAPAKLQAAYNTYGEFTFEILVECTEEELHTAEEEAIQIYNSLKNGFNSKEAGDTGAVLSSRGENNSRALYTNTQILEVFNLLISGSLTHKEIAKITNTSLEAVSHVSSGTGHKWLRNTNPLAYDKLVELKYNPKSISPVNIKNIHTGELILITSVQQLLNMCTEGKYSTVVSFLSKKYKTLYGTWEHIDSANIKVSRANKKPTYVLRNEVSGEECSFTSILRFFEEKALTNRRAFSSFLQNTANINNTYQGWVLASIC